MEKSFFFFGEVNVDQRVGDSAASGVKISVLFELGFFERSGRSENDSRRGGDLKSRGFSENV